MSKQSATACLFIAFIMLFVSPITSSAQCCKPKYKCHYNCGPCRQRSAHSHRCGICGRQGKVDTIYVLKPVADTMIIQKDCHIVNVQVAKGFTTHTIRSADDSMTIQVKPLPTDCPPDKHRTCLGDQTYVRTDDIPDGPYPIKWERGHDFTIQNQTFRLVQRKNRWYLGRYNQKPTDPTNPLVK